MGFLEEGGYKRIDWKETSRSYPANTSSIRLVRHMIEEALGPGADDAMLIGSEFATNSVTHGPNAGKESDDDPEGTVLGIIAGAGHLTPLEDIVFVADRSPKVPIVTVPDETNLMDTHGKGLQLVQELSNRWGYDTGISTMFPGFKKVVYAVVPRKAA